MIFIYLIQWGGLYGNGDYFTNLKSKLSQNYWKVKEIKPDITVL